MRLSKMASATALAVAMVGQAQASTVFESFPNFATAGDPAIDSCSSCTGYGTLLGSFTLSAAETLNKAFALVSSSTPSGAQNAMTISIFNDGGNDLPSLNGGGGIVNPFLFQNYTSPTSVTLDPFRSSGNLVNYVAEFALPNWQLAAGKYWIRFAGYSNSMPLYTTATPSHSRAVGTDLFLEGRNVTFNPSNLAIGFSLNGVDVTPPGGVPEPASWALMIAGFGLTGAAMRRRAKVTITYA